MYSPSRATNSLRRGALRNYFKMGGQTFITWGAERGNNNGKEVDLSEFTLIVDYGQIFDWIILEVSRTNQDHQDVQQAIIRAWIVADVLSTLRGGIGLLTLWVW